MSLVTQELRCRESISHELAPVWGGAHERAQGRLVYVATGAGAPDFGLFSRALWSTELVTGTPYAHHRWAYDTRIFAGLQDPADPAVAADGSGLVVAARLLVDDELVCDRGRHVLARRGVAARVGGAPGPLPDLADGAFERRSRVRGRLRGRTLTLVNRNRFWVTARVRRRTVRLQPATRRRASLRRVRVGGRVRRVRIRDAAGHRRAIRVRSLSA